MLLFWRFCQGLCTPGVFSVTVAYINDEWAGAGAGAVLSSYVSGTVLGGFSCRFISGLVASHFGWRWVFIVLGVLTLAGAGAIARLLEPERHPHHAAQWEGSWFAAVMSHLKNRQLLGTYLVGFCVLFSLVAIFTYVTFYLAAPPFNLEPAALGSIFFVYLIGAAVESGGGARHRPVRTAYGPRLRNRSRCSRRVPHAVSQLVDGGAGVDDLQQRCLRGDHRGEQFRGCGGGA